MRNQILLEQGQQLWPIKIDQRVGWVEEFAYVNADDTIPNLTSYTAKMQIRRTVDADDALLTLTTDVNGGIQIDGLNAILIVTITPAQAALLPLLDGINLGWYDLLLNTPGANGNVEKLLSGPVTVVGTVTQQ